MAIRKFKDGVGQAIVTGSGVAFTTPTYESDVSSEGKEPDYVGDHFGWDDIKPCNFGIRSVYHRIVIATFFDL